MNLKREFIATPPAGEDIRGEFARFVETARKENWQTLNVLFGFAWANDVYDDDWIEEAFSPDQLQQKVQSAERRDLGRVCSDDLFVEVPNKELTYTFCHENDIHIEAALGNEMYDSELVRFLKMKWTISERQKDEGGNGDWTSINSEI